MQTLKMADERTLQTENTPSSFCLFGHPSPPSFDVSVAIERCPICRSGCHPLFCSNCVLNGSWHQKHRSTSLSSGLKKLIVLSQQKSELDKKINERATRLYERSDKQEKIQAQKRRLDHLKKILDKKSDEYNSKKSHLDACVKERNKVAKTIGKVKQRLPQLQEKINSCLNNMNDRKLKQESVDCKLMKRKKQLIVELNRDIFNLREIASSRVDEDDPISLELADASNHQFVKGQWAYIHSTDTSNYEIIGSQLSSTGEYPHIIQYISKGNDGMSPQLPLMANSALQEWIALGYTSQFIYSVAKSLDLTLPFKTYIPRLVLDHLKVEEFYNFLAQLNYNLIYIYCSQGADMSNYELKRLIYNLFNFIHLDDIGRSQPFTLSPVNLLQSIESQITCPLKDEQDRAMTSDDDDDEWLNVSESLPMAAASGVSAANYTSTTELVTSAISSVMTSFWPFNQN